MPVDMTSRLPKYIGYTANKTRTAGITVSGVPVGTDALGLAYILGAADRAASDPTFTTQFVVSPTSTVTLNAAEIVGMKNAAQTFVNAMFAAEASANAALTATPPTIATFAEVDALFAAVPKAY